MSADYIIYSIAEGTGVTEAQQALEFLKYEGGTLFTPEDFCPCLDMSHVEYYQGTPKCIFL